MVQTDEEHKIKKKPSNLIANSSRPSQSGYDAEIVALDILKKEGFEIIFSPEKLKRDMKFNSEERRTAYQSGKKAQLRDAGWYQYMINPVVETKGGGGVYGVCSYREIRYDPIAHEKYLKSIEKNPQLSKTRYLSTPKEIELLQKQFWNIEYKHRELCEFKKQQEKLMLKIIGKSITPKSTIEYIKKRIDDEVDPAWKLYVKSTFVFDNTFVDIFCKKNGRYYIIDVKFKNDQILYEKNNFDVTDFEALNYPNILKKDKVGLLILIIVADEKKFRHTLTEWSDFIINPKYNPHEKKKTRVKMKNLIPFEKLKKITISKKIYSHYT
jgi:hypothetical protein